MSSQSHALEISNSHTSTHSLDGVNTGLIRTCDLDIDLVRKRIVVHVEKLHAVPDSRHALRIFQVALSDREVHIQTTLLNEVSKLRQIQGLQLMLGLCYLPSSLGPLWKPLVQCVFTAIPRSRIRIIALLMNFLDTTCTMPSTTNLSLLALRHKCRMTRPEVTGIEWKKWSGCHREPRVESVKTRPIDCLGRTSLP